MFSVLSKVNAPTAVGSSAWLGARFMSSDESKQSVPVCLSAALGCDHLIACTHDSLVNRETVGKPTHRQARPVNGLRPQSANNEVAQRHALKIRITQTEINERLTQTVCNLSMWQLQKRKQWHVAHATE